MDDPTIEIACEDSNIPCTNSSKADTRTDTIYSRTARHGSGRDYGGFALLEFGAEHMVKLERLVFKMYTTLYRNPLEIEFIKSSIDNFKAWLEKKREETIAAAAAFEIVSETVVASPVDAGESATTITKIQFLEQELAQLRQQMSLLATATAMGSPSRHPSDVSTPPRSLAVPVSRLAPFCREEDCEGIKSPTTPKLPVSIADSIKSGDIKLKRVEDSFISPGGTFSGSKKLSSSKGGMEDVLKSAISSRFKKLRGSLSPTNNGKERQTDPAMTPTRAKAISAPKSSNKTTPVKEAPITKKRTNKIDTATEDARVGDGLVEDSVTLIPVTPTARVASEDTKGELSSKKKRRESRSFVRASILTPANTVGELVVGEGDLLVEASESADKALATAEKENTLSLD